MTTSMDMFNLLIIDDDPLVRSALVRSLRHPDLRATAVASGDEAVERMQDPEQGPIAAVILDLHMPGRGGLEVLADLKRRSPETHVVMLTGHGTVASAVQAMRLGADDYLEKPCDIALLRRRIETIFRVWLARQESGGAYETGAVGLEASRELLLGNDPFMRRIREIARQLAASDATVLVQGESGTGKEQFARAVHYLGPRASEPLVVVDTATLSPTVIESELFGHGRGAFTGAGADREGLIRSAGNGTVFLDEIGELPLNMQAKLLRVLQEREVRAVGTERSVPVSARFVAATNRDLATLVNRGMFRADLFHRLNVVAVHLPPLRKRVADIPLLAAHFIARYRAERPAIRGITDEALDAMKAYDWPGNVRELENMILRALVVGTSDHIQLNDLSLRLMRSPSRGAGDQDEQVAVVYRQGDHGEQDQTCLPPDVHGAVDGNGRGRQDDSCDVNDPGSLAACEQDAIMAALKVSQGNRAKAARILDIGVATLYRKLKKYPIPG